MELPCLTYMFKLNVFEILSCRCSKLRRYASTKLRFCGLNGEVGADRIATSLYRNSLSARLAETETLSTKLFVLLKISNMQSSKRLNFEERLEMGLWTLECSIIS